MLWWIAAGFVVGAELLTGTVYLLLLSIGMAVAGLSAWMGVLLPGQMLVCAGGRAVWRWRCCGGGVGGPPAVGQLPSSIWTSGTASRSPAGSRMACPPCITAARPGRRTGRATDCLPGPGEYAIVAVDGARLVLGPIPSTQAP